MLARPAQTAINLRSLDGKARNGEFWLLAGDGEFAVARWAENAWLFRNGRKLRFKPDQYAPR